MKKAAVVIRKSPFNTLRNSEGLRMSVGLTLAENAVRVIFVDDGVYTLVAAKPEVVGSPEVKKHIDTLRALGHQLIAEKESLDGRGIANLGYRVDIKTRDEIAEIITESDAVIAY
ncbi:MAG: DsrE family protein [Chloroflexi bacterium]|nr:DsrE family protein [Chloroflexota bacterium]